MTASNRPGRLGRTLGPVAAVLLALSAGNTLAASKTEIKLGNTAPYSGPASFYGYVGFATSAYFAMVNDQGGINGRKVTVLSVDDALQPPKTVEQTRKLVEQDEVDAVISQVGTAPASAVRQYLNQKKVPQLFVQSGSQNFNQPKTFPYSSGALLNYEFEGRVYGRSIAKDKPNAKVGIVFQNDDFGKDYVRGLEAGLGKPLAAKISYEQTDPTMDSQVLALKEAGVDVVMLAAYSKQVSQTLRKMNEMGWKPEVWMSHVSAQVHPTLSLVGLDKVVGVMSAGVVKDPTDASWHNDADYKAWLAWMKNYYPNGDVENSGIASTYAYSAAIAQVLKAAGDDLSREGILKAATQLKDFAAPMLMPGITMTMEPTNYQLFRKIQPIRFDGKRWVPVGKPVGD